MHGESGFHLRSACLVPLILHQGPHDLASAGLRPRSSARLGSVSAAAGDERLPASRSALVPPGSRRPHGEWTAFISCIGLAQLTAASGGPPREMPAAGFAAKGSVQCHVREFRLPGAPGG